LSAPAYISTLIHSTLFPSCHILVLLCLQGNHKLHVGPDPLDCVEPRPR
jgi:hypothetical protein